MLTTFFADIADFRRPQERRYKLRNILTLSVIAYFMQCEILP